MMSSSDPFHPARRSFGAALAILSFVLAAPALAQAEANSSPVLIVAGWSEQHPGAERVALRGARIADEVLQQQDSVVVDVSALAPPEEPASTELASELHECINGAIRAIAAGDLERGSREIARCQQMIARARPALLGQDATAGEVFDACLVAVRVIMQNQSNPDAVADALAQTHSCRAEVPLTAPTGRRHSRPVMEMVESVDAAIEREGGILIVRHPENARCEVRLNHRTVGYTPVFLRLGDGTYELSADCPDETIRSRRVQVRSRTESEVTLQPAKAVLSRALPPIAGLRVVRDRLTLVSDFASPDHFEHQVREVTSALDVDRYVTVWAEVRADGEWRYRVGSGNRRGGGGRSIPWTEDDDDQRAQFASTIFPPLHPIIATPVPDTSTERFDPTPHVYGSGSLTLAGLALAGVGIAYSMLDVCVEALPNGPCTGRGPDWPLVGAFALPGLAAGLAGVGWLLGAVAEDALAWWIASATAAAGALASFIVIGAGAADSGECTMHTDAGCVAFSEVAPAALGTWGAAGALMGAASIVYAIVGATDEGRGPRLQLSVGPLSAHFGGTF